MRQECTAQRAPRGDGWSVLQGLCEEAAVPWGLGAAHMGGEGPQAPSCPTPHLPPLSRPIPIAPACRPCAHPQAPKQHMGRGGAAGALLPDPTPATICQAHDHQSRHACLPPVRPSAGPKAAHGEGRGRRRPPARPHTCHQFPGPYPSITPRLPAARAPVRRP